MNLNLFSEALTSPIARRNDPEPSKSAASEITASGRREGQLIETLELVKQFPRSTSLELAQYSGRDRYMIARRLPELQHGGLVTKSGIRQCGVGKRPACTWEAL